VQTFKLIQLLSEKTRQVSEQLVILVLKELIAFLRNISRNVSGRTEIVKLQVPLNCSKYVNDATMEE